MDYPTQEELKAFAHPAAMRYMRDDGCQYQFAGHNLINFARLVIDWHNAQLAKQEPTDNGRSEAYYFVDRQLRNTLDDTDYAEHSTALDIIYAAPTTPNAACDDAKDAARYRWLANYLPSDRTDCDDAIIACSDKADLDAAIDALKGGAA